MQDSPQVRDRQSGVRGGAPADLSDVWRRWIATRRWDLFATLTFRDSPCDERAEVCWRAWLAIVARHLADAANARPCAPRAGRRTRARWLAWTRATEWQRRGAIHFHALLAAPERRELFCSVSRQTLALEWQRFAGYALIERVHGQGAVIAYLAKYVAKEGELTVAWSLSVPALFDLDPARDEADKPVSALTVATCEQSPTST